MSTKLAKLGEVVEKIVRELIPGIKGSRSRVLQMRFIKVYLETDSAEKAAEDCKATYAALERFSDKDIVEFELFMYKNQGLGVTRKEVEAKQDD